MQYLSIDICEEAHSLLLANKGWVMVKEEEKDKRGVQAILLEHHMYIDTCASYASTPYPHLLQNMEKQACGLVRHSNVGSCRMDTAGEMGASIQMWLNKDGVTTIVSLKVLDKIWLVLLQMLQWVICHPHQPGQHCCQKQ